MSSWFWSSGENETKSTEETVNENNSESSEASVTTDVTSVTTDAVLVTKDEIDQPSFKNFVEELKQFRTNNLRSAPEAEIENGVWKKTVKKAVKPKPFEVELAFHRKRILNLTDKENSNEKKVDLATQNVEDLREQVETLTAKTRYLEEEIARMSHLLSKLSREVSVSNFQRRSSGSPPVAYFGKK